MSTQKFGVEYLKSYSGILNLTEVVLNFATLVSGVICGFLLKTCLLSFCCIYALLTTGLFIASHTSLFYQKYDINWSWIEFGNSITVVIAYILGSSIVISELTKQFIITGVIGYITTMVYVLDAVDKYKLIRTPRARYVWNTPDMPV